MVTNEYKDLRDVIIQVGDYVMYGKSCRHTPVSLGTKVLGDGCTKEGLLHGYNIKKRVLVLPDDYRRKL